MSRKRPPSESAEAGGSYEVGYGKPPRHTQFKPGHSGNSRGRPRGRQNFRTIVQQTLNEKVPIREGERTRKISKGEAIVLRLINSAVQGDTKFIMAFLQMMRVAGLIGEEESLTTATEGASEAAADRQAILNAYVARRIGPKASSAPSPVLAPPELLDDDAPDEPDEK